MGPLVSLPASQALLPTPSAHPHLALALTVCAAHVPPHQPVAGYPPLFLLTALAWLCGNQHRVLTFPKKPFKKQHTEFLMVYVCVLVSNDGWEGKERLSVLCTRGQNLA